MHPRRIVLVLLAGGLLPIGCASTARSSASADRAAASTARTKAPVLLSSTRPQWRVPSPPREGRVLDLRVTVQIDSTGQPDLESLRVTGLGADENREVVTTWVRTARFRPAEREGQAVAGVYETRFELTARVRRVSGA